MKVEDFRTGIYEHFKGMKYLVLGIARHSESLDYMVVYVPLYDNQNAKMWVRPFDMFIEDVTVDGVTKPRFRYVGAV